MQVQEIKISELNPAEYNPREISDFDLSELKKSITKFGVVEAIVVNKDLTIIGGHQRVKAATELGIETVPCFVLDLNKTDEKALNLALNKIQGYFNEEKLADILAEIRNEAVGFSEEEVNQYALRQELRQEQEGSYNPDDDEELKKLFDRKEKVEIGVHEPNTPVRSNKIGFYVGTMEEYTKIRDCFSTTRKGELDKDKLISYINSATAQQEDTKNG